MTQVNVLHIISSLQYGGAEKFLVALANKLNKERFRVAIYCLSGSGPLEGQIDEDVEIIKSADRIPLVSIFKLFWVMKNRNIKIAHTHLYKAGFLGRIAAKLAGVPIIITHEQGLTLWKKRRHIVFERLANNFTDLRIADGEDVRTNRIVKEKTPPEKIIRLPCGVDIAYFNSHLNLNKTKIDFKQNHLCIGTVCRLVGYKGVNYLLKAAKEVISEITDVSFLIVGDGPAREELEDYTRRLGIEKRVAFTGFRSDVREVLTSIDIFVSTSTLDVGMPTTVFEAMAMEKPVITTTVGTPEVYIENEISGIMIPPKDPKALANAIIRLIRDEKLREKMAKNGRKVVSEQASTDATVKKIEFFYEHFLKQRGVINQDDAR